MAPDKSHSHDKWNQAAQSHTSCEAGSISEDNALKTSGVLPVANRAKASSIPPSYPTESGNRPCISSPSYREEAQLAPLENTLSVCGIGTWQLSPNGRWVHLDKIGQELLFLDRQELSLDEFLSRLSPAPFSASTNEQAITNISVDAFCTLVMTPQQAFKPRILQVLGRVTGTPGYSLGFLRDVTARVQQEDALKHHAEVLLRAQHLDSLRVLAGGLAHDFNNLLCSILGNAELALFDASDPIAFREHIERIQETAERAAEICQQILSYAGYLKLDFKPIDLCAVLSTAVAMVAATQGREIPVKLQASPLPSQIEGDERQLLRVFRCFVENATEALPEGKGQIDLALGQLVIDAEMKLGREYLDRELLPGLYATIDIHDDGCGMDSTTLARVFEPFFSTKFTGRGLGLSVALGIIRAHHGTIAVSSVPGQGSHIRLLLPALAQPEPPSTTPFQEKVVMIVEGCDPIRAAEHEILSLIGFSTVDFSNIEAALEELRKKPSLYTLLLLDETAINQHTLSILSTIKECHPKLSIILTCCNSEKEEPTSSVFPIVAGVIHKPFELAEFLGTLSQALNLGDVTFLPFKKH